MLSVKHVWRVAKELTWAQNQHKRSASGPRRSSTTSVPKSSRRRSVREHCAPSLGRRSPGRDIRPRSCTRAWLTLWENIASVPQGSALEAFLIGRSSVDTGASDAVVMPFHSNLDQRNAIRAALTHQISIIDGPPGTGKTQTILNLIASLIAQGKTVGVVASANSAVENVVKKLSDEGYGFLIATSGAPRASESSTAGRKSSSSNGNNGVTTRGMQPLG